MQIDHLGGSSKRKYSRWEIRNNMYRHCRVAADSGLGCSLSRSILVESCRQTEFPVPGMGGGQVPWVERVRALLHMGQAGHSFTAHWLLLRSTLNTTARLTDWMGLLTSDFSHVGHSKDSKDLAVMEELETEGLLLIRDILQQSPVFDRVRSLS